LNLFKDYKTTYEVLDNAPTVFAQIEQDRKDALNPIYLAEKEELLKLAHRSRGIV